MKRFIEDLNPAMAVVLLMMAGFVICMIIEAVKK